MNRPTPLRPGPARASPGVATLAVGTVLWLVLMATIIGIAVQVLGACAIGWREGEPFLTFCPEPEPPDTTALDALSRVRDRGDELTERLDALRLALITAPDCPEPEPEPEPPVEVAEAPPPPPEFPVPSNRPEPPPLPDPPPEPQVVEAPPLEDIPEDAWNNRDVSFLEGCWTLISPQTVQDRRRTRPIGDWRICFDQGGNGQQSLAIADGEFCQGAVRADFAGNELSLTSIGDLRCRRGTIPQILQDCTRLADGTAECIGRQPTANRWGIRSIFRR